MCIGKCKQRPGSDGTTLIEDIRECKCESETVCVFSGPVENPKLELFVFWMWEENDLYIPRTLALFFSETSTKSSIPFPKDRKGS